MARAKQEVRWWSMRVPNSGALWGWRGGWVIQTGLSPRIPGFVSRSFSVPHADRDTASGRLTCATWWLLLRDAATTGYITVPPSTAATALWHYKCNNHWNGTCNASTCLFWLYVIHLSVSVCISYFAVPILLKLKEEISKKTEEESRSKSGEGSQSSISCEG